MGKANESLLGDKKMSCCGPLVGDLDDIASRGEAVVSSREESLLKRMVLKSEAGWMLENVFKFC